MSLALYPTRLYWADGRGAAKLDGEELRLAACPQIFERVVLDGIDYAPEVIGQYLPRYSGCTEMDGSQLKACLDYLRRLFGGGKEAAE